EELQGKVQRQEEEEEEEPVQTKLVSEVQRQEEEPEEEEEELQTKPAGSQPATVSENLENRIKAARGGGHPLSDVVQKPMGRAFGADFSGVRVHTDSEADALNKQLSAKAFTTGQDVFFRENEYSPGSDSGRELIAHELTHVVQQTSGTKLRPKGQETKEVSQADDNARGKIQRKTRDVPLYRRFTHVKYSKIIAAMVDRLAGLIRGYNIISILDTDYDHHLAQLHAIKNQAFDIMKKVALPEMRPGGRRLGKPVLQTPGSWRALGGPFRRHYHALLRGLVKLAGPLGGA
ncbi:MAG: DUF4157 domain-containing protein, partial [candidate division Zixibacteria bacterium]|nr:DUF4157 domain-containing protein [candidate division Zixibacteria bacterium]